MPVMTYIFMMPEMTELILISDFDLKCSTIKTLLNSNTDHGVCWLVFVMVWFGVFCVVLLDYTIVHENHSK